ncbi:molybdopterin dinucleotide binding domain-containing protein, partial [Thermodesulfobacteriota bacterium]
QPCLNPVFKSMHTGQVIIEIAQAMGGSIADSFPWGEYEECLRQALGDLWDTMSEDGFWEEKDGVLAGFDTPSGRFEFAPSMLRTGAPQVPELPEARPIPCVGNPATYPLTVVPCESMRLANGAIADPPFVIKTVEDTVLKGNDMFVEINPGTAKAFGLTEGCAAILTTPRGSARVGVHLRDGIMPDLVGVPKGLGHTAYDKYLADKGINYNGLVGPVEDPATGYDVSWGIRARLTVA